MAFVLLFDLEHFLLQPDIRLKQLELLVQVVDQLLTGDLGEAGDIINIFLRVKGSNLPPS
ncbi:hypothetical protein HMSSN036_69190 [Paenibacillus macerans]|nr:hypothetical protein HMSSN036_69190 [Paenibacillus macerans]